MKDHPDERPALLPNHLIFYKPLLLPCYICNGWLGVKHQITYKPLWSYSKVKEPLTKDQSRDDCSLIDLQGDLKKVLHCIKFIIMDSCACWGVCREGMFHPMIHNNPNNPYLTTNNLPTILRQLLL